MDYFLPPRSPIEIDERHDEAGQDPETSGRRASCKGFLSISILDYLQLLDWTGREIRIGKAGSIPAHLAPILNRIGLDPPACCDLVKRFGRPYHRAAGTAEHLAKEATRRGNKWMCAPGNPLASS